MSDIRDLLRVYGVDPAERDELEELAIRARGRPWWRDYADVFENEFPGFESDAVRIRVFMPLILPGLLQTREYMEALWRTGSRPPAWQRRAMEARLRRQQILNRDDDTVPKLTAVITEASLMYRWGAKADRREQIEHLIDAAGRTTIELRIQRFRDGPPRGLHCMVNIFDLPDEEPSLVYVENDVTIEEVSKPDEVANYIHDFARASDGSLVTADTMAYLKELAEQLE
jgi:hypothetical protein